MGKLSKNYDNIVPHTQKNYKMTTMRQLRSQAFSYSQKDEGSWVEVGVKKNPVRYVAYSWLFSLLARFIRPSTLTGSLAQASSYVMAF